MPRGGEKNTEKDKGHSDQAGHAGGDAGERSDDKRKPRRFNQYGNKNRHNRNYGKNRYHGGGGDRRHYKKARFDVGERLKEVDLGITEYINEAVEGFTGTIKERYTDFVVHEISTNGEIAKLTDQEIPADPDFEDIEDLKKKIPEEVWEKLQTVTEENAGVEIDVTEMDREQRRCIHKIVKKLTTVISETKDVENKKLIVFEIGKALLKGNWEEAVDLILKPREGEQDINLAEAREIYKNTKDSRLAYQKIGRNDKIEAKLLWGINICGQKNLVGALDMVPRNTMLMYVHAYQSMVWNNIVSRRRLKPIVGDLVYENPNSKDDIETPTDDSHQTTGEDGKSNADAKEQNTEEVKVKIEDSKNVNQSSTEQQKSVEKKEDSKTEDDKTSEKDDLTADLKQKKTKSTVYPTYAKSWFDDHLEKDGLTADLKQKKTKSTLFLDHTERFYRFQKI